MVTTEITPPELSQGDHIISKQGHVEEVRASFPNPQGYTIQFMNGMDEYRSPDEIVALVLPEVDE